MTIALIFLFLQATSAPASRPAPPPASQPGHRHVASLDGDDVPESSGIVASRLNPDVYWTHNDSGDGPRVWAFRLTARDRAARVAPLLGSVELRGADAKDWEDIAWGADGAIYVFDGGDNPPCKRTRKQIYRFREPRLDLSADGVRKRFAQTVDCESMWFEYPDPKRKDRPASHNEDCFDAECLLVHPATGDIYIVTKRDNRKVAVARVYRFPGRQIRWNQRDAVHVLQFVTDLTPRVRGLIDAMTGVNAISGGDIDATGTRVVLRDYLKAMEFVLPAGRPFENIFDQAPQTASLIGEPQGEAICFTLDGKELITTSEMEKGRTRRMPVYAVPSPAAP